MTKHALYFALFLTILTPGGGHFYLKQRGRGWLWLGGALAVLAPFLYRLFVILQNEAVAMQEAARKIFTSGGDGGDREAQIIAFAFTTKDRLMADYGFEFRLYIFLFIVVTIAAGVDLILQYIDKQSEVSS